MASFAAHGSADFKLKRNGFPAFTAQCREAATRSVDEMGTLGERRAKTLSPKRTRGLERSIRHHLRDRTTVAVSAGTDHALPQETGSRPHIIPIHRGDRTYDIHHPGNRAHPYLRPALRWAANQWRRILPRFYPS